jgi:hypothetical protein
MGAPPRRRSLPLVSAACSRSSASGSRSVGHLDPGDGAPRRTRRTPPGQHDRADQGREQQHRQHLEGQDPVGEDRDPEVVDAGPGDLDGGQVAERTDDERGEHHEQPAGDRHGQPTVLPVERLPTDRRPGEHETEQEQHRDGTDVDHDLHQGQEVGRQRQEHPAIPPSVTAKNRAACMRFFEVTVSTAPPAVSRPTITNTTS